MPRFNLSRLLSPKTVAVVGGQSAATVARMCKQIGFAGQLYAVHPTRSELGGITCARKLDDLPAPVDACFLGVSPQLTVDLVAELEALRAGGAVCYASGFAEAGSAGSQLQDELAACAGDMPLIGPNCHGFINYLDGVALWPDHFGGERTDRGPALLVQSGNIGINATFQQRELGFSYVIAMGNNAKLEAHDYMHALLDDPRVTAIGLHLEGIGNVPEFSAAALRALKQRVPVVAIKSGSSALGASLALGHTRSLASPDELVNALFEHYGVARCATLPELLETLKFVSIAGAIMPVEAQSDLHPRIASMSCSGGEASHLADLASRDKLEFPALSDKTTIELSSILGDRVHVSNPLDYHTYAWGDEEVLTEAFTRLLREPLDCALLILDYPPPEQHDVASWQIAERALCAASQVTGTRVAVVSSLPESLPASARKRLCKLGIAPMQGLQECVRSIRHAHQIGRAQHGVDALLPVRTLRIDEGSAESMDEWTSKRELARYGLSVPKSLCCRPEQVAATAEAIGFPVVIKACGPQLVHKTELNAVRVGINSVADAKRHACELATIADELLVEAMVVDAVAELFVGVTHDADFGQVLVLGAGGVKAELARDSVLLLLPASRQRIERALSSLDVNHLLRGYRGAAVADVEAVMDAIMAVCAYAAERRNSLLELDVNPLLARPQNREDATVAETPSEKPDAALTRRASGVATPNGSPGAVVADAFIRRRSGGNCHGKTAV